MVRRKNNVGVICSLRSHSTLARDVFYYYVIRSGFEQQTATLLTFSINALISSNSIKLLFGDIFGLEHRLGRIFAHFKIGTPFFNSFFFGSVKTLTCPLSIFDLLKFWGCDTTQFIYNHWPFVNIRIGSSSIWRRKCQLKRRKYQLLVSPPFSIFLFGV